MKWCSCPVPVAPWMSWVSCFIFLPFHVHHFSPWALKLSLDVIFLPYWSLQSVLTSRRLTEVFRADFRCVIGFTPSWPLTLQSCCVTQESTCSLIWWLPLQATTWVWCCPLSCPSWNATSSRTSCPNWRTWESRWVSAGRHQRGYTVSWLAVKVSFACRNACGESRVNCTWICCTCTEQEHRHK